MKKNDVFTLKITETDRVCKVGEEFGRKCRQEGKIPVFSCEGGCIKGEIARQAANMVAKSDGYARACHGELFSVPKSDLADWVKTADKVVVIDGCGIRCHGRIAENILTQKQLFHVDALAIHQKYAGMMDVDEVPEAERRQAAREVADKVLAGMTEGVPCCAEQLASCDCPTSTQAESPCCST